MRQSSLRRPLALCLLSGLTVGLLLVAACGNDDGATASDVPDASTAPDGLSTTPPPGPGVPDGGEDALDDAGDDASDDAGDDAGQIADGGDLPPEDDGGADLDGGFDAGPTCSVVDAGPIVESTCNSNAFIVFVGGALTTTTYQLQAVTVRGSQTFCAGGLNGFRVYQDIGGLEVTASSATNATFRFLDRYRKKPVPGASFSFYTTNRYDAEGVAAAGKLTFTPLACALKPAPAGASYTVGTKNGKKTIALLLPYGTGTAIYSFIEPL